MKLLFAPNVKQNKTRVCAFSGGNSDFGCVFANGYWAMIRVEMYQILRDTARKLASSPEKDLWMLRQMWTSLQTANGLCYLVNHRGRGKTSSYIAPSGKRKRSQLHLQSRAYSARRLAAACRAISASPQYETEM